MNKTITYSGFAISTILIFLVFVTAKNYTQLTIAVLLYPLLAYFALKLFPRKIKETPILTVQKPAEPVNNTKDISQGKVEIVDIDKRTFLKLIGTAGISFFIFSLLGRRADDLIFGKNLEGNNKTELTPSNQTNQTQPLVAEGFRISEIDDSLISYYGFTNKDGGWLIMREDGQLSTFRYTKGGTNFSKNWANRKKLKYNYYHKLFSKE